MNVEQNGNPKRRCTTMPLVQAAAGQEVRLAEIRGGRGLTHRLAEMGLTPGARMRVVANNHRGPFIISVRESRLMLGRGMIDRIFVTPV